MTVEPKIILLEDVNYDLGAQQNIDLKFKIKTEIEAIEFECKLNGLTRKYSMARFGFWSRCTDNCIHQLAIQILSKVLL